MGRNLIVFGLWLLMPLLSAPHCAPVVLLSSPVQAAVFTLLVYSSYLGLRAPYFIVYLCSLFSVCAPIGVDNANIVSHISYFTLCSR